MKIQPRELAELFLAGEDERAMEIALAYLENHSHNELYHELIS